MIIVFFCNIIGIFFDMLVCILHGNAVTGCFQHFYIIFGITYSKFLAGMKKASIDIDRKMLAELAVNDPAAFGSIVAKVKAQLA